MAAQAVARLITPQLPRELPPAARKKVERAIERHLDAATTLTAYLDNADGDADFEDPHADLEEVGDDEPSLGSLPCVGYCGDMGASPANTWDQTWWAGGLTEDREEECEDEGAQCDDEGAHEHFLIGGAL